jgi:hypothetical protein
MQSLLDRWLMSVRTLSEKCFFFAKSKEVVAVRIQIHDFGMQLINKRGGTLLICSKGISHLLYLLENNQSSKYNK